MSWNYTKSALLLFLGMVGLRMLIEYDVPGARYQDPLTALPLFLVGLLMGVVADLIAAWRRRSSLRRAPTTDPRAR